MPKKKQLTEPEVRALIISDAKIRLGCSDFEPAFQLHRTQDDRANWNVFSVLNADDWKPDCAEAFKEAVARTRRKFDIAWPLP